MHVKDIPQLTQLTIPEKMLFLEELWDNIYAEADNVPMPQSHITELDNRLTQYNAHPDKLLSLEELQARITSRR